MARTPSTMLELGTSLPSFELPDTDGKMHSSDDQPAKGTLVMFICNHCPFVIHVRAKLAELTKNFQSQGVQVFGINSNDVKNYPDDSPEKMKIEKSNAGYTFPYLFDETQKVAQTFRAACTPDFYLFDSQKKLVYRGQFDDSRPGNQIPVTGNDLRQAVEDLIANRPISQQQKPSIGCNIKWKAGNEPEYFGS